VSGLTQLLFVTAFVEADVVGVDDDLGNTLPTKPLTPLPNVLIAPGVCKTLSPSCNKESPERFLKFLYVLIPLATVLKKPAGLENAAPLSIAPNTCSIPSNTPPSPNRFNTPPPAPLAPLDALSC